MGKGASMGEEAALAASGLVGEVAAGGLAAEKNDVFSILLDVRGRGGRKDPGRDQGERYGSD